MSLTVTDEQRAVLREIAFDLAEEFFARNPKDAAQERVARVISSEVRNAILEALPIWKDFQAQIRLIQQQEASLEAAGQHISVFE